jgi:hypothetical protein
MKSNRTAKIGAVFYLLWGIVHVAGAGMQLVALRSGGGGALGEMIATARTYDPATDPVPEVASAFMGMGAFNLLWIGLLVSWIALRMNWKNSVAGYWLNLGIVGATDLGLVLFLLASGTMAWTDGSIGLSLYLFAAVFSTVGLVRQDSQGIPGWRAVSGQAA